MGVFVGTGVFDGTGEAVISTSHGQRKNDCTYGVEVAGGNIPEDGTIEVGVEYPNVGTTGRLMNCAGR